MSQMIGNHKSTTSATVAMTDRARAAFAWLA